MKTLLLHSLPPTLRRVQEASAPEVNKFNRQETDHTVAQYAAAGKDAIGRRIHKLEQEWDIERTLETNAAILSLVSVALGYFFSPWWYALTAVVAAFLLQHALHGWCPPVPILRRLGIRTAAEIFEEITALRILREDFTPTIHPAQALAQVRATPSLHADAGGSSSKPFQP